MTPFAAGVLGLLLGFVLRSALDVYLQWRANRPRSHRITGNYFDDRTPFHITADGPRDDGVRSDEAVERHAARLGRLRTRRWNDVDVR